MLYQYGLTWLVDGLYKNAYHKSMPFFAFAEHYLQTDELNDLDMLLISEFQSSSVYLMIKELVKLHIIWVLIYFFKNNTQHEKPAHILFFAVLLLLIFFFTIHNVIINRNMLGTQKKPKMSFVPLWLCMSTKGHLHTDL